MKLTLNNWLATLAVSLGVSQIFLTIKDANQNDKIKDYNINYILLGILSSMIWLTYQYRIGANYSAIYTSMFLLSQIYLLHSILSKVKVKWPPH